MLDGTREALEARIAAALDATDWDAAATTAIAGYGPEILGYLIAVTRDRADAQEIFSSFAEDLWKGLPGFRRQSSFRTWAYKLAWHAATRFAEDPYRKRGRALATGEASRLAEAVRSATAPHLQTAVKDKLARLRASLAPDEQTLLVLRIDRRLSWQEVCDVMAAEEAALRKRFERLKEKLRRLARAEGLLPDP